MIRHNKVTKPGQAWSARYAPINSKLQPPPPRATPRAFELLKIGSFKLDLA